MCIRDSPQEGVATVPLVSEDVINPLRLPGISLREQVQCCCDVPRLSLIHIFHGAFAQAESESTSSRVRWGKRQAMKSGHVTMQYKQLLGYEKGPDGKPRIVPEQAETVRFIYDRYLAGDSIQEIKAALEERKVPTVSGKEVWMGSHIRSILTNEKYCGDVLLQKTFKMCIRDSNRVGLHLRPGCGCGRFLFDWRVI